MGLLSFFNRGPEPDPSKDDNLGDGFLTQQGYTLVWVGWQFDVPRRPGMIKLDAPVSNLSGVVRADFTTNDRALEYTLADLAGYSPSDLAAPDATLTSSRSTAVSSQGAPTRSRIGRRTCRSPRRGSPRSATQRRGSSTAPTRR
jgi:hypothetical protein